MQIISRAAWGARHARGFRSAPLPARELYLHHSVTAPGNGTPAGDAAAVRTLEDIGQSRFGGGISYTFAVTPSGRVYEGHGIDRQGAHTGGRNSIARAICLIGNYDTGRPPEAMVQAVAELVAHGHRQGWWPNRLTGGHRDAPGASTACPGRNAHALIPEINRRAIGGTPTTPEVPDMDATQARQLAEVHRELTQRLGRRIEGSKYADTVMGFAMNADSFGFRAAEALDRIETAQADILARLAKLEATP